MTATSPTAIREDFDALERLALAPVSSAGELEANLAAIYRALLDVDLDQYDMNEVRGEAGALSSAIFALRQHVHDRIGEWHRDGLMTREVQKSMRDVYRASRYAADMLGELANDHARLGEGHHTYAAFTGPAGFTDVHPPNGVGPQVAFRSGDVILQRGSLHNSAAIARIGDMDSQFSHVAMVYIDEAGRQWAVESLIEEGAIVTPLEENLAHDLGRAVLLRHRDADLAHRAAKYMHDRVLRARRSFFPIRYDFSMEIIGSRNLYCSKLVRRAFDAASDGEVKLPTFGTRLDMKNRDFFRRIGVTAYETFAPGDLELEPDFAVVAEWRDYRVTARLRLQDMIMTKLFEWMETRDYVFKPTFTIWLMSVFGRGSSYLSESAKSLIADVVPKVPVNMRRSAIAAIAMLHHTAEPLLKELESLEEASVQRSWRPLHPREAFEALERIREASGGKIGYLQGRV